MINCERCKQKMTLHDLVIVRDKETGIAKKYCEACAAIINTQQEGKKSVPAKKEESLPEKPLQPKKDTPLEDESSLVMEQVESEPLQRIEINPGFTDIVLRDHIVKRIETYLGEEGVKIADDDYCYIKIVGNHLEIGRAKIILEE